MGWAQPACLNGDTKLHKPINVMSEIYELSCDCGHVTMTAHGEPKLSLYCHCASCRALYNTDMLSATGWADEQVELPEAGDMFAHKLEGKQMTRYGCPQCGMTLYGRHKPGIPVIPHGVFRKANGCRLRWRRHYICSIASG